MDMDAVSQMSRNTYRHSKAGTFVSHNFNYRATHVVPGYSQDITPMHNGLGLTSKITSSVFLPLSHYELEVKKGMADPNAPTVYALNTEVDAKKPQTTSEFKVGGGMKKEIEDAFDHPMIKVKEVAVAPPTKKPKTDNKQTGQGAKKPKKQPKIRESKIKYI